MKRYTLAEIAAANEAAGGFFYARNTLKFFGQKKSDFKVRHIAGRVFVYAPARLEGKVMHYSFVEFSPATGKMNKPKEHRDTFETLAEVENFLESLKQGGAVTV